MKRTSPVGGGRTAEREGEQPTQGEAQGVGHAVHHGHDVKGDAPPGDARPAEPVSAKATAKPMESTSERPETPSSAPLTRAHPVSDRSRRRPSRSSNHAPTSIPAPRTTADGDSSARDTVIPTATRGTPAMTTTAATPYQTASAPRGAAPSGNNDRPRSPSTTGAAKPA